MLRGVFIVEPDGTSSVMSHVLFEIVVFKDSRCLLLNRAKNVNYGAQLEKTK